VGQRPAPALPRLACLCARPAAGAAAGPAAAVTARARLASYLIAVCLLALALLGPGAGPVASRQGGPAAEADEDPDAVTVEVLPDDPAWQELTEWVSQLRGLPILRPVPRVALSPAAFRARQADLYRAYLDQAEMDRTRQLLVGMGVLEPDADLPALLAEIYSVLPIGTYDALDKVIYLRRTVDPDGPLQRMILAHEFTHALQDQHYDLQRLYRRPSNNADRDQAISTLLEGDAIILQQMYLATTQPATEEEQAAQQQVYEQALQQVYVEIRQTLSFDFQALPTPVFQQVYTPYLDGPGFIHNIVGTAALTTWGQYGAEVRRLFLNPPQSTSQVLHPEKYRRGWQPTPIELRDPSGALGGDWQLLRRQVVGELDHRALLGRALPEAEAIAGADGWAGNRALVLADKAGQTATVSETRWDSGGEAAEWGGAFAAMLEARYEGAAKLLWADGGRRVWEAPDQAILLEVGGPRSLVVQAPTVADVEALADRLSARRPTDLRGTLARLFDWQ
jgi:hypothetical protein